MAVSQSQVKVDSIEAYDPVGSVSLSYGATVPSGQQLTVSGDVLITGVATATSFSGNGSNLTNLSVATSGKSISYKLILSDPPLTA